MGVYEVCAGKGVCKWWCWWCWWWWVGVGVEVGGTTLVPAGRCLAGCWHKTQPPTPHRHCPRARSPPLAVVSPARLHVCTGRSRLKSHLTTDESSPPDSSSQGRCGRKATAEAMLVWPRRSVLYCAGRAAAARAALAPAAVPGPAAEPEDEASPALPAAGARLSTATSPASSAAASHPPLAALAARPFTSSAFTS